MCNLSTSSAITVSQERANSWSRRLADYVELTKPRIMVMVLVTVAISGVVATWGEPDVVRLLNAVIATGFVAASASVMNQWLERGTDAMMPRTANRPLPAGRLGSTEVFCFGLVTAIAGLGYLWLACGLLAMFFAALTWFLYVCVYTPLKTRSWLNTAVGAVPGALPVLIGWVGVGAELDARAWCIYALVFLWQFPHFMAIAWLYRKQYAEAGMPMLPVVEPTGLQAGLQSVIGALLLLAVSLVPWFLVPTASAIYLIAAFILGAGMFIASVRFCVSRNDSTARTLLRASLIYLPIQLTFVTVLNLALI